MWPDAPRRLNFHHTRANLNNLANLTLQLLGQ